MPYNQFQRKHQAVMPLGVEPGAFDDLKAKEIDYGIILLQQLNDIRKLDNEGKWRLYTNAVRHLETLLWRYVTEESSSANQFAYLLDEAEKEYTKKVKDLPAALNSIQTNRYLEKAEKEFADKKLRALILLMAQKNLLPRDRLG